MSSFENQKILITGATGGIGKATVIKFLEQGANVFITGTDESKLQNLVAECQKYPGKLVGYYTTDVSDPQGLLKTAIEAMGGLDVLVHAAGMTKDNLFIRMSLEDWQKVLDVNLSSAFKLAKDCATHMMKQRYGRMIFVTSVVGSIGNIGQTNYITSKAGLTGFAKGLGAELASRNVTVNCVEPGFIDTAMTEAIPEELAKKLLEKIPMQRMGKPEEVAHSILFLASKDASYITGSSIRVNGGMYMN